MSPPQVRGRTLAMFLIAFSVGLAVAPTASADPNDAGQPPAPPAPIPALALGPAPAPGPAPALGPAPAVGPAPAPGPAPVDGNAPAPAAVVACKQFAAALRVSSKYYNEFASSIAGEGNYVDYQDPAVMSDNVDGRTALRKSAAEAWTASATPGLQPEIAAPMRSWSVDATKLLLVMGLRGGGDRLNNTATELNNDAKTVQMACAKAGTKA